MLKYYLGHYLSAAWRGLRSILLAALVGSYLGVWFHLLWQGVQML